MSQIEWSSVVVSHDKSTGVTEYLICVKLNGKMLEHMSMRHDPNTTDWATFEFAVYNMLGLLQRRVARFMST